MIETQKVFTFYRSAFVFLTLVPGHSPDSELKIEVVWIDAFYVDLTKVFKLDERVREHFQ